MIFADLFILFVVIVSVAVSAVRGFVKEAMSLIVWVLAIWAAITYSSMVDEKLMNTITSPSIRIITAFAVIFLPSVFFGAIINKVFGEAVKRSGLTGTDRALGLLFGSVRGVIIVSVLILLAGMTTIPQETWWQESLLLDHFQGVTAWLKGVLPDEIAARNNLALSLNNSN